MKGQVKTMFRYDRQSRCSRLLLQSATGWPFHITSRCWKVDIVNIHHLHFCLGCTRQSTYWVGHVFLHSVVSREYQSKTKTGGKGLLEVSWLGDGFMYQCGSICENECAAVCTSSTASPVQGNS
jgi:hypothetical protein